MPPRLEHDGLPGERRAGLGDAPPTVVAAPSRTPPAGVTVSDTSAAAAGAAGRTSDSHGEQRERKLTPRA